MNRERVAAAVALAAVAVLATLGGRTHRDSVPRGSANGDRKGSLPPALSAPCPPGTLPDEGVCVPVPAPRAQRGRAAPPSIPRRPDRDPDYARYELPIRGVGTSIESTGSGSDGGAARPGILIRAKAGADVRAVWLEGQEGETSVVYAGPLIGPSVVTLHVVADAPQAPGHESDRKPEYLVVLGNLGRAPALAPHAALPRGASLGVATVTPVYLDVRRVRAGTDVWALPPDGLIDDANSVSVDPRNVLGLVP